MFGAARGRFFFGLPGNPASTMVTFELFASAALELLGGQCETAAPARLDAADHETFSRSPALPAFCPPL